MERIRTEEQLQRIRESRRKLSQDIKLQGIVEVRVALATCGLASGAKGTYDYLVEELQKRNIEARVIRTGCMGYCYAEPTVEVTLPGKEAVVFADVDTARADQIIERYIRLGETMEGVIPRNYERVILDK
jgi:NADP-reducing hydrogenase subunit HndB